MSCERCLLHFLIQYFPNQIFFVLSGPTWSFLQLLGIENLAFVFHTGIRQNDSKSFKIVSSTKNFMIYKNNIPVPENNFHFAKFPIDIWFEK
jgi:hypothetical protein